MPTEEEGAIAPTPKKAKQEEAQAGQRAEGRGVGCNPAAEGSARGDVGCNSRRGFQWLSCRTPSSVPEIPAIPEDWQDDLNYSIPTLCAPKDPGTTRAVQSSKDKVVVLRAARSIVSIAYIMDDGKRLPRCTGMIIRQWSDAPGHHHAIIVTYSRVVCKDGRKLDPLPKLSVCLPDKKTILDAELIYFNDHYDIALLDISLDFTLGLPSIGRGAEYGQEVFVLARDGEASMRVRRGNIKWLEESDILGRDYYMFLSSDIPEGGNGGMVIDHNGELRGMAVYRVARPVLGFSLRTIALLDVQLQEDISDIGIDGGFVVDEVFLNNDAEKLGIKPSNVIISINGQDALTLPELRVCDLKSGVKRDVTLPVTFYDKAEK
ncbi:hypothetical protein SETIT_3G022900v2, partial [Setaria italica]|uniref:PDZ domain-containing protein n=1 Tax=Setaria italica TaxID=4555 RepID=K3ZE72_SETIT